MNRKNIITIIAIISIMLCFLTSCNKENDNFTFKDEGFRDIIASTFNKSAAELTTEDFDDVVGIDIYYYALRLDNTGDVIEYKDVWSVTICKDGYHAAYEEYYSVPENEREGITPPYDFAYNQKLDSFEGYEDLKYFKNVRDITFNSEYVIFSESPLPYISHMKSLEELVVYNYAVPDVSILSMFNNLKTLSLGVNLRQLADGQKIDYLSDITPLSRLKNLESISLSGNSVNDFSALASLPRLKSLSCSMAGVSDISSISNLKNLEYVNLFYNAISDVEPLTKLPKLKTIILDYNYITDVSPFAKLNPDVIESISLDMNSIEDLTPMKHLGKDKIYVGYDIYWD